MERTKILFQCNILKSWVLQYAFTGPGGLKNSTTKKTLFHDM